MNHNKNNNKNAWVTSALGEDQVPKALILAASLRAVASSAKLVVVIPGKGHPSSSSSSSSLTAFVDKLEGSFDLVVSLDKDAEGFWGGGGDDEQDDGCEWVVPAVIHAFSLVQFEKVAFLSPNMVVVSNCDEIFDKAQSIFLEPGNDGASSLDPSVMLLFPSTKSREVLKKTMMMVESEEDWRAKLCKALQSTLPLLSSLDGRYNTVVGLFGDRVEPCNHNGLPVSIGNFKNGQHPWELYKSGIMEAKKHNNGAGDWDQMFAKLTALAVGLITGNMLIPQVPGRASRGGLEQKASDWTTTTTKKTVGGVGSVNNNNNEPIAIVGLSFRLPGGNNEDEFWHLLIEGKDAIRKVPPGRWTKEHSMFHYNGDTGVEAGFLDVPVDEFDAKFFGTNPKDAVVLDPQIRLLHEVSWEALEQAGIDPSSLRGSQTGIFVGSWMHNYQDLVSRSSSSSLEQNMFRVYMGNSIGAESARLSHFFGTTGPAISTESGCSSSMVAVHLGVKSLRNRECNMALACGVNLLIHPFTCGMMEGVMAPDYRCKTFDAKADGFARAEGVAALVMKRLSDAVRDGDSIWGLIRGSAVVQEGHSKSLGTPTIHCEALAMELALRDAGLDGGDVDYIEAHGTGTTVGDPMEVAAITKAYASSSHGRRQDPLVIGSVKTNVGHTESVSGLTGIIKVLLAMKHERIPPHLHLETLNPEINLEALPALIPLEPRDWPKSERKRRRIAGVSSFGITGTDGHVIIEEPPVVTTTKMSFDMERPLHALKLSAKCPESLEALLQKYEQLLESTEEKFEDICYSANTGRSTFSHRAVILAKDGPQASKILKDGSFKKGEVQGGSSSGLCFLFTGQGSQYPGMAKGLYDSSPTFKTHFDAATRLLREKYSISIKEVMWGEQPTSSSSELLNRTLYSQTSIFVVEYCLLKLWESWGVIPDYVMGHSLGELAAAVAAGALTFEDALMLVAGRSRLVESLPRGKMLVIKANKKTVYKAIANFHKMNNPGKDFWVDFAAVNSADQTVVAGEPRTIQEFAKYCEEGEKLKYVVLASTHAFHSRHMDPMLEEYGRIASTVRRPSRPPPSDGVSRPTYISGMEGKVIDIDALDATYWVRHTREKVSFMEACKTAQSEGCTLFLEVGPHPVLSALTLTNMEGTSSSSVTCLPSLRRKTEDWSVLLESISKLYLSSWKGSIDWKGLDKCYNRKRVPLPFYPFNKKSIWVEVRPQLPLLHPLLGRILPTCSTTDFIYESGISSKSAHYLQDHVIGNTVIFPGAGFLELCLSAGFASSQGLLKSSQLPKPRRAIALKNLKILAPMALLEGKTSNLQTTVNLEEQKIQSEEVVDGGDDDDVGYPVRVCRFVSDERPRDQEWTTHATARFLPVLSPISSSSSSSSSVAVVKVNPSQIQSTWEKFDFRDFYSRLPELGLRFGPTFQSLECGWRSEGGGGILFKVKTPQDSHPSYLIHPVVADAMLQALMVWSTKLSSGANKPFSKRLQVPVYIGHFVWLQWSSNSERYIYCNSSTTTSGGKTVQCHLVDGEGAPLASMSSVEFVETSVKLVEGLILQQQQSSSMTGGGAFWEEIYRASPGPLQNRLPPFGGQVEAAITPELREELAQSAVVPPEEEAFFEACAHLTRCFFLDALYRLGWESPQAGQPFTAEEVATALGIQPQFIPYLVFFFRHLAAPPLHILQMEEKDHHCTFQILAPPPTPAEIRAELSSASSPAIYPEEYLAHSELQLITEVGKALKGIWLGSVSPLSILFPEDPARPSAAKFYQGRSRWLDPLLTKVNLGILMTTFDSLLLSSIPHKVHEGGANNNSKNCVVRVLEIGAGTGAYTHHVINNFESKGFAYEYHFTDISAAFFNQAAKEFGSNKSVIFKKYDMEVDPLEQGFTPEYFDLVLAAEVLHIAKDVKGTLKRVRCLLKPGGLLQLIESLSPDPTMTFVFGLLEGYWQFRDYEFRRWHTTLSPPMWEEALREARYEHVVVLPAYMGVHGLVLCERGEDAEDDGVNNLMAEVEPPRNAWILFDDDGSELTRDLEDKLVKLNRSVSLFQKPARLGSMSESEFKGELAEFLNQTLAPEGMKLEGVLYLWGLTTKETDDDQQLISLPLVTLCQLVVGLGILPSIHVVTQGVYPTGGSQVLHPSGATLTGIVRCINNEHTVLNVSALDLDPELPPAAQADELFYNLWGEKSETFLFRAGGQGQCHHHHHRLVPKLASVKPSNDYLPLPNGCDRFRLVLPETKLISDLEFTFLDNFVLEEGEIEVEVKAMGLNFRDVMVVLKPVPEFDRFNAIGLDVAGVVSKVGPGVEGRKVGDRVIGMQLDESLALPSHLKMKAYHAVALPGNMTFVEGATLPAVFSTAYYCLVRVAKMKAGETLLIHTASGGVGLCAIQFAKRMGVEVIATAGSNRKRTFLRNLGIQHVFNSRNTEYGQQILEVTGGRGVDVVLNSLTGPGFKEESLRALGRNGRFVEMSKMNVWSVEEVRGMRPDLSYTIADLTSLEESEITELYDSLKEQMRAGAGGSSIEPIPYERFDALNIRGALNYLQKAKHVGKIVCVMPELKGKVKYHERTPMFNADSAYLVTGGLGGIGFEVVKWILRSGGKHVAIASRSPPNPEMADKIDALNRGGTAHVVPYAVDVGSFQQCQQLFEHIRKEFPPLRGVMHAAGVLADATIDKQSWANFRFTYNPKVEGTRNLHELTKALLLEHFVLFSSGSATFGSPGQSNHSAANCFEDAFAHYRRSIGLPATTINWGNWGEVGVATEIDFPGLSPISTAQGITALETCLRLQRAHTAVINVDSFSMLTKLFPRMKSYLDDKRLLGQVARTIIINSDEFWAEVDSAGEGGGGREDRVAIFKKHIITLTRNTLNLEADEVIDENAEFSSLGVDSLMMLEMKNALQALVGSRLTITAAQVKDCTSPGLLATRLVDLLEGQEEERNLPSLEELREMIEEDCILPDHIAAVDPTTLPPSKSIDQVRSVLLTGATGNLGPFLLLELSRAPQVTKIYCLIRKGGKLSPSERLRSALAKAGISDQVDLDLAGSKVECLQGDISQPSFGMPQDEYHALTEGVDAVFHAAVLADHTAKYWKSRDGKNKCSRVRSTNVGGTLRVLEFCVEGRPKHLFHASSLAAINTLDEAGLAATGWQTNDAFSTITTNSAYPISKFVSEQLVKAAGERGLVAVTALRLPLITGHSGSGRVDFKGSHFHLLLLAMLKLGCMPEVPVSLAHIPVDTCAKLCVQVGLLHPEAYGEVYNVHQRSLEVIQVLATVARQEFGIHMEFVSHSEFFAKVGAEPPGSPLDPFKEIYEDEEKLVEDVDFYRSFLQMYIIQGEGEGRREVDYGPGKISKLLPDFEERMMEPLSAFLRRDLNYIKAQGVFDKFGIKESSGIDSA